MTISKSNALYGGALLLIAIEAVLLVSFGLTLWKAFIIILTTTTYGAVVGYVVVTDKRVKGSNHE
jgi:uncharacterized membrane protein YqgA involved in biofilm formation